MENESKNEGFDDIDDQDEDDENKINCTDKLNSCTRKIFCGSTMFTCGVILFNSERTGTEFRRRGYLNIKIKYLILNFSSLVKK
jgi:hypothetical protein